jgi:tyrosine-protein phosphatase YwqE
VGEEVASLQKVAVFSASARRDACRAIIATASALNKLSYNNEGKVVLEAADRMCQITKNAAVSAVARKEARANAPPRTLLVKNK